MKKDNKLINHETKEKLINSDFYLILSILKDLFLFLITLPFDLLFLLFFFILFDKEKIRFYFSKIFVEPFRLIIKVNEWFFAAKYTSGLILFLIFMYIIQVIFFYDYMNSLMDYPLHFFEGNFYSVLTSIFLHADLGHLFGNCLVLLIFGRVVEKQFKGKILLIFLASGIVANIISNFISLMFSDIFYSLGASGAIAGLILFAILIEPFSFTTILFFPMPLFLVGWAYIISDLIGLLYTSQINHLAHLGGYLALLVIFFFLEIKHRKKISVGFMINLILILVSYILVKIIGFENLIKLF